MLKFYIVTENQLDYDDYPMGSGTDILVTASKQDALRESSRRTELWEIPRGRGNRVGRSMKEYEVTSHGDGPYEPGSVHMLESDWETGVCRRCGVDYTKGRDQAVCR